jgi:hypothetical protein
MPPDPVGALPLPLQLHVQYNASAISGAWAYPRTSRPPLQLLLASHTPASPPYSAVGRLYRPMEILAPRDKDTRYIGPTRPQGIAKTAMLRS